MMRTVFTADRTDERLDLFLVRRLPDLSRSYAQRLIEDGRVTVDGTVRKANYKLRGGEEIIYTLPPAEEAEICAEDIPLDVLYEDADIIVVNKARGMVVHPAAGIYTGTLVNALLWHCHDLSGINGALRPGIVHRLDKDTSGVMVAAKNDMAHHYLARQIRDKDGSTAPSYTATSFRVRVSLRGTSGGIRLTAKKWRLCGRTASPRRRILRCWSGSAAIPMFPAVSRRGARIRSAFI